MIRWWMPGVVVAVGLLALPLMFVVGFAFDDTAAAVTCAPNEVKVAGTFVDLDPDQTANARIIISVGATMRVPTYGRVIAIATAMQESKLHNLTGGDRDSVGLFQQRANWGSYTQRHDPRWSSRAFYAALLRVARWQRMPLTVAAQAVQNSGFPDAYAQWQPLAERVVGASTAEPGTSTCADATLSGVVSTDARAEAAAILKLWGTRMIGNPQPRHDLAVTAAGRTMTRCGHTVALDADLLHLLLLELRRFQITAWGFMTGHGDGCEPFYHPPGMAIDIGAVKELSTGRSTNFYPGAAGNDPAVVVAFIDDVAANGPDHLGMGQAQCGDHAGGSARWRQVAFTDSCTHQHVNVHQNDAQWGPYVQEKWPQ